MQKPKPDIEKKILETAARLFFKKGFQKTSMRMISRDSGVGLSNIYNYFKNKDEIMTALVQPVILKMNALIRRHHEPDRITLAEFEPSGYHVEDMQSLIEMVNTHRESLMLLLFNAHGSVWENYRETLIEQIVEMGEQYLATLEEKYPRLETTVSRFFLRQMGSFHVNMIAELVRHPLPEDKQAEFLKDYVTFVSGGWKYLLKV